MDHTFELKELKLVLFEHGFGLVAGEVGLTQLAIILAEATVDSCLGQDVVYYFGLRIDLLCIL